LRLITLKIWRAFPELDSYPDDVCRNYVRHARRLSNIWKGAALTLLTLILSFFVWVVVIFLSMNTVEEIASSARGGFKVFLGLLLMSLLLTGVLWFPVLCAFLVRDRWLRHSILSQLKTTDCAGCGYQLIGLTIQEADDVKFVTCPECGNHTKLNTGHITEADIDPKLLGSA